MDYINRAVQVEITRNGSEDYPKDIQEAQVASITKHLKL